MKRITKALPVALLLGTLFAAGARAQGTYTAADCNRSSVNAVINGPTHIAVNGDVIQIPSGACTWTGGITVPSGIGITIIGSGTPNSTASTTGASSSCTATAITDNYTGDNPLFLLQPTPTSSLSRVSCMKVLNSTGTNTIHPIVAAEGTCNSTTCPNLRIDNVTFDGSLQTKIIDSDTVIVTDNVFGVLDHNSMAGVGGGVQGIEFVNYNNSAWNGVGQYGDNSWASADSFGASKVLYVENNAFGAGVVIGETEAYIGSQASEGGGRIVGRFNTCNGCLSGVSNHGTDSNGRPRGGRQIEFYGNTFRCTDTKSGCQGGVPIRSGVAYMFSNSLTVGPGSWFNQYMAFSVYRTTWATGAPWGACNGGNPYDNNSPLPVVCVDQSNRSGGTLFSGDTPSPVSSANQTLDPSYEWNDSGYDPPFGNVALNESSVMSANKDWYTDNSNGSPQAQTSATSPFNGTSGVGFGTLADRPSTCTPRVGYWATDQGNWNSSGNGFGQGELFVCTATNTWTLYYTPYTYPHPLAASGGTGGVTVTPPTNLRAVSQ
jgi:hypothetical protein